MIYSGAFSVAKISARGSALSRIIPTPGKCSFNCSHGQVQRGSPWMVPPGDFPCSFFCCFQEDLFLTPMGMAQEQDKIRNEPVADHGTQRWMQLSTGKAKWSPDYLWNQGSSQFRALFEAGCPEVRTLEWVFMEYWASSSLLTGLWASSLTIPLSHGSLQWHQVCKVTNQRHF